MISEEKLKQLYPYWRKAQEFVIKNKTEWIQIRRGSDDWRDWMTYFQSIDFMPAHMKTDFVFSVPAQHPEWFDPDYVPPTADKGMTEQQRWARYTLTNQERYGSDAKTRPRNDWEWGNWANGNVAPYRPFLCEPNPNSYDQLCKLHGRPVGRFEDGTKWTRHAGRQVDLGGGWKPIGKKVPKPLTDDDLRKQYAPNKHSFKGIPRYDAKQVIEGEVIEKKEAIF